MIVRVASEPPSVYSSKGSCEESVATLRLRVHVYGMSQTCPHDFFKNQYSGFLHVQVIEGANGFL